VVVLQLNPGHDDTNSVSHADPAFRAALLGNLLRAPSEWPFYFLDPRFRESHPGGRWWTRKTRKLAEAIPLGHLVHRLAVVEWFPYKSVRYGPGCKVQSQEYGFSLVANAIARGALIVIARGVARWQNSVPALRGYSRLLTLSSTQNIALTPNNMKINGRKEPRAWELLIRALE
jgi:hypothetical protein